MVEEQLSLRNANSFPEIMPLKRSFLNEYSTPRSEGFVYK
jgi:hypothetical protein